MSLVCHRPSGAGPFRPAGWAPADAIRLPDVPGGLGPQHSWEWGRAGTELGRVATSSFERALCLFKDSNDAQWNMKSSGRKVPSKGKWLIFVRDVSLNWAARFGKEKSVLTASEGQSFHNCGRCILLAWWRWQRDRAHGFGKENKGNAIAGNKGDWTKALHIPGGHGFLALEGEMRGVEQGGRTRVETNVSKGGREDEAGDVWRDGLDFWVATRYLSLKGFETVRGGPPTTPIRETDPPKYNLAKFDRMREEGEGVDAADGDAPKKLAMTIVAQTKKDWANQRRGKVFQLSMSKGYLGLSRDGDSAAKSDSQALAAWAWQCVIQRSPKTFPFPDPTPK
ncbi:hypothetical protein BDK51DRAFT_33003 [Blyttiomyces helicus]|uniref:Uncharacterized protein n=1 Tax=Blyttiomyces helicus TaxID=388810 RepID=A0A4P9W642_9FUNG|nr:hypothetical protein BDK51DRAFT_33003 [Blyttiomyces helicus]|eukprot:RKO86823.1 hypothetical protein BDK51DRAFT_33003 [Blyttiomyces helicus]